jgi:hypothetical protein
MNRPKVAAAIRPFENWILRLHGNDYTALNIGLGFPFTRQLPAKIDRESK